MKKILGLVLTLSLLAITAGAQDTLPIQGQDTLRNYALGQGVRGFRDVQAPSMVLIDGKPNWVEVTGTCAEDVLTKLFDAELQYSLVNTNDTVTGRVWLYDKDDNLLFFGDASYLISALGKDGPTYNIWMQRIPLPLDDVEWAEILALAEDGVTANHSYPEIRNGHIMFDPWMSGAPNGILLVRTKNGTFLKYNLWNPVQNKPDGVTERNPNWKIDGHYVVEPSEKDVVMVQVMEAWTAPTVYLTAKKGQKFKLDVLGVIQNGGPASFERPLSYTHEQQDGPWAGAGKMESNQPTTVSFPTDGIYRIQFDWNLFAQPQSLYTGPYGDGGGKVIAVPVSE